MARFTGRYMEASNDGVHLAIKPDEVGFYRSGIPTGFKLASSRSSDEHFRNAQLSNESARPVGIPLVAANEADLNENDRAGGGNCRRDVFAEAVMPEFVREQT